jgi:hypothetical protein
VTIITTVGETLSRASTQGAESTEYEQWRRRIRGTLE